MPPTTSDDHHLLSSVFSCLSLLVACLPHDQCKDWLDWLLPYAAAKELSETSTKAYATSSETSSSYNMPAVADQTIVMLSGSEFTERSVVCCLLGSFDCISAEHCSSAIVHSCWL